MAGIAAEAVGAATGVAGLGATGAAYTTVLANALTASAFAGPIGAAVVGADGHTWDCWKPVVMDDSVGLSHSITLRDLFNHPNLRRMTVDGNNFIAENIRGEQFRLSPVSVDGTLAFHATPSYATHEIELSTYSGDLATPCKWSKGRSM
jgi:hypothetical protein